MAENSKIEWCDHTFNRKRPVCRSRPQDLPAAEPAPVGSNPLGAGRRWLGQLQVN
jgi:hypothetical protein